RRRRRRLLRDGQLAGRRRAEDDGAGCGLGQAATAELELDGLGLVITTPLNSTEPSGCFVRIKSMNKTFTPELSPEVLERLRVYAAPFQAELRHQAQRSWSGVYLRGLLQDGERKSIEAMVARVPLPAELRDIQDPDQALQQFVNQSPWDTQ